MEKYFYLIRSFGLWEDAGIFQQLFFLELFLLSEEFCFEIHQLHQQQNEQRNNQAISHAQPPVTALNH